MRFVWEIEDHPEGSNTDQDSCQPFQDENPGPAPLAANAVHLANSCSEETTKGARYSGSGKEDSSTNTEFAALVPATKIVVNPREQSSFSHAEKKASGHHAMEIVSEAHGDHDDAPEEHDDRDEDGRAQALKEDIGQRLEEGVGDEEDGEAGIVLAAGNVKGFIEVVELRVADVGPIEEGNEVQEAKPGNEAEVELPEEFAVLCGWVSDLSGQGGRGWRTMAARSASLRPASGSGGRSSRTAFSNWPAPTPVTCFSSSEGERPLSLSRILSSRPMLNSEANASRSQGGRKWWREMWRM